MPDKHQLQWERLGATDPYWAVLTDNTRKNGNWNAEEFFQTGKSEIKYLFQRLEQLNLTFTAEVAVDFGCGVGRLSRALAEHFTKVIGIDVSSSMLGEARSANAHIPNIEFIHNVAEDLSVLSDISVNFIYSNIVLQHMPQQRQSQYIKEFCRILGAGGVLVFQTPSQCRLTTRGGWAHLLLGNRILNVIRKWRYGEDGVMEIHTFEKSKVIELLTQHGMSLAGVDAYDSAGPAYKSYRYFAVKS